MMQHAINYATNGFAIFPCRPGDKQPLGSLVPNGCLDATTDENKIKDWWTKCPNANIGIATGEISGLAVVDLDGPEGIASAARLGISSNICALTGNGKQLFYADTENKLKNSVKRLAPGIDTRGKGGYIVAPPSLHPNGKRYAWASEPLVRARLFPLPALFLFETQKQQQSVLKKPEGWIAIALEEMKKGHVHNTLISVLGKFRSHNFSEEDTFKLLQPYALVDDKPFEGLRDKISEIWKRYEAPISIGAGETESIDEFLEEIKEVDWLCKPFFAKKSFGFVVGLPETLKTWLLVDLAVESARDSGNWLGIFGVTSSRVLFIDQERFKGETQRRFNAVIAAKGLSRSDLKGKLFLKCGTTIKLDLEDSYRAFRSELLHLLPDLVIVDSFATFHNSPENDRMAIQQVLNKIKALRDEIGCTFLFINHENKMAFPNGEPQGDPNMGTMNGSIGISAAAEFVLTVRKIEDGTSMVWHTKSTLANKHKAFYATVKDVENGIEVKAIDAK